jgi:hypothetical protein
MAGLVETNRLERHTSSGTDVQVAGSGTLLHRPGDDLGPSRPARSSEDLWGAGFAGLGVVGEAFVLSLLLAGLVGLL